MFGRTPQPPIAAAQSSQNTSSGAAAAAADTASPMDVASASPAQSDGAAQSDTAAAAGAAASDAGVSGTDDAGAKMQLEALHVLLMIMQASPVRIWVTRGWCAVGAHRMQICCRCRAAIAGCCRPPCILCYAHL